MRSGVAPEQKGGREDRSLWFGQCKQPIGPLTVRIWEAQLWTDEATERSPASDANILVKAVDGTMNSSAAALHSDSQTVSISSETPMP